MSEAPLAFVLKLKTIEGDPLTAEQWEQVNRAITATAVAIERKRIRHAMVAYWWNEKAEPHTLAHVLSIVEDEA